MDSRRDFIKKTAPALAFPLVSSNSQVFSIFKKFPSNRLNVAVIGTGDRGQGLMRLIKNIDGIELVAFCDILPFRIKQASAIAPKAKKYNNHLNYCHIKI